MRRGEPDEIILVVVKKVSGRRTWTTHLSEESFERERDGKYWEQHGRKWKMRYRINVYLKGESHGTD